MEASELRCELCGAAAPVRVLTGYLQGKPVMRRFCLACADRQRGVYDRLTEPRTDSHLGIPGLMMGVGLVLGTLVLATDIFGFGGSSGFGWYQRTGVVVGAILVLLAGLLRIDVLGVIGTIILIIAGCADFLGLAGTRGIGWQQQVLVGFAAALAAAGLILRRFQNRPQRS